MIPMARKKGKLRITVLKRQTAKEIFGDNPPQGKSPEACDIYTDGQEFIVDEEQACPEGFCTQAWNDIVGHLNLLWFGGEYPWMNEKGSAVVCCTDGYRPVIFEINRIQ